MFTLAHLSDPHLGPLPTPTVADLMGKRLFGYLSWLKKRRSIHRPEVLAALTADLPGVAADHVVITGDMTNISLLDEFAQVGRWLRSLGAPDWITVVPGNHDAYVAVPWERSIGHWHDYMSCDGRDGVPRPPDGPADFPIVRLRGDVAIIGLTTARPTPLFFASGSLGEAQLRRLEACLEELGRRGLCRVVLLHHPPHLNGTAWRKRLTDAAAFRAVVARSGAELVLHGHDHVFQTEHIDTKAGEAAVFGVPSASAGMGGRKPQAHYQIYGIERDGGGWRVQVSSRGFDPTDHRFREAGRYEMVVGQV